MKSNYSILLVEDDPNLGQLLAEYLQAKGHNCVLKTDGEQGYSEFKKQRFDFLILDVMMPIKDGFTLAKEIRRIDKTTPILFLTARSMKDDKLEGFEIGADDYMTKPFSIEELLARMKAILKRAQNPDNQIQESYQLGKLKFCTKHSKLEWDGQEKKLTTKESELLKLLCLNANGVVSREQALELVWGDSNYFNSRSMDVYITKLRKHLAPEQNLQIVNVHGQGFKLILP